MNERNLSPGHLLIHLEAERLLCTRSCAGLWGFRDEWHKQSMPEEWCREELSLVGKRIGSRAISGHCNASKCRGSWRSLGGKVKNGDAERIWEMTLKLLLQFFRGFISQFYHLLLFFSAETLRQELEREKMMKRLLMTELWNSPFVAWRMAWCLLSVFFLRALCAHPARHTNVCSVCPGLRG